MHPYVAITRPQEERITLVIFALRVYATVLIIVKSKRLCLGGGTNLLQTVAKSSYSSLVSITPNIDTFGHMHLSALWRLWCHRGCKTHHQEASSRGGGPLSVVHLPNILLHFTDEQFVNVYRITSDRCTVLPIIGAYFILSQLLNRKYCNKYLFPETGSALGNLVSHLFCLLIE